MSAKLRRRALWSAAVLATQALAFGALAQQPDPTTTRDPAAGRATQSQTPRQASPAAMDRSAGMKAVSPQTFANQAAVIGKAEIELGQLAMQKSQDQQVREYAQLMVKDHTAADSKLKKIAAKENITLPQTLDAEHMAVKQKLAGLSGAAFDREYKKEMAKGHDKAVALFESASQSQQLPAELKEFAASTLQTLEEHQSMAHSLHEKEGA